MYFVLQEGRVTCLHSSCSVETPTACFRARSAMSLSSLNRWGWCIHSAASAKPLAASTASIIIG